MDWAAALAKFAKKAISGLSISLIKIDKPNFYIVNGGNVGSIVSKGKPAHKKFPPKSLPVDISLLSKEERLLLQKALKEALDNEQTFLLEDTPGEIDGIRESQAEPDNKELLTILQPFLSSTDFAALRAAVVLRYMRKKGLDVIKLKGDIVHKYGDRGAKMANLCSAGYFDDAAKQLKTFRSSPKFNADEFRKKLDDLISQSAFALFVQNDWPRLRTRNEIITRIRINAGYGIHQVVLHAIGEDNMEKVREITDALIAKYPEINKAHDDTIAGEARIHLVFPSKIAQKLK